MLLTIQELSKAQCNNTDINNTDYSDTDPFLSSVFHGQEDDGTGEFTRYYEYFYDKLEMEYLKQDFRLDGEILELILRLIVEVMCSNRISIQPAESKRIISSPIRFDSLLSPEKSHRRKQIRLAMKQR